MPHTHSDDAITPEEAQRRFSANYTPADPYQQARLALRSRVGTEPTQSEVGDVMAVMHDEHLDAIAAVKFLQAARAAAADEQPASDQDRALADAFLRTYRTQETELRHAREKVQQLDAKVTELRGMSERDRAELRRLHPFEGEAKDFRRILDHPYFHHINADEENSLVDNVLAYLDERTQGVAVRKPALGSGFSITLMGDGGGHSSRVEGADTGVAGLARLRAHAALDSLLDQHGISR